MQDMKLYAGVLMAVLGFILLALLIGVCAVVAVLAGVDEDMNQ